MWLWDLQCHAKHFCELLAALQVAFLKRAGENKQTRRSFQGLLSFLLQGTLLQMNLFCSFKAVSWPGERQGSFVSKGSRKSLLLTKSQDKAFKQVAALQSAPFHIICTSMYSLFPFRSIYCFLSFCSKVRVCLPRTVFREQLFLGFCSVQPSLSEFFDEHRPR